MKVFVTQKLAGDFVDRLAEKYEVVVWPGREISRKDLLRKVRGVDAILSLLTERIDAEVMEKAGENLKIISNCAVGFDNVEVSEATRRGIVVTNTPAALSESVAEHAIALMLTVMRRIVEGDKYVRSGKFKGWEPDLMVGMTVRRKVLGVVGMGRIGEWTARLGYGLGMKVIYYSRSRSVDVEKECKGEYKEKLDELLKEADVISLNVPLNKETEGMIGKKELMMMKKTAVLINTARGAVVKENELIEMLKEGRIAGAGLDVFEDESRVNTGLFKLDNVVLTPHIASATNEARELMAEMAVNNILRTLAGEEPEGLVNEEVWCRARVHKC